MLLKDNKRFGLAGIGGLMVLLSILLLFICSPAKGSIYSKAYATTIQLQQTVEDIPSLLNEATVSKHHFHKDYHAHNNSNTFHHWLDKKTTGNNWYEPVLQLPDSRLGLVFGERSYILRPAYYLFLFRYTPF